MGDCKGVVESGEGSSRIISSSSSSWSKIVHGSVTKVAALLRLTVSMDTGREALPEAKGESSRGKAGLSTGSAVSLTLMIESRVADLLCESNGEEWPSDSEMSSSSDSYFWGRDWLT